METKVLIWSGPKPNAVNPPTQWCFWWNLITIGQLVSEIFMFESGNERTPARVPYYKLTLSLQLWWANKTLAKWRDHCHLFTDIGQFCHCHKFLTLQICLLTLFSKVKFSLKFSKFTVSKSHELACILVSFNTALLWSNTLLGRVLGSHVLILFCQRHTLNCLLVSRYNYLASTIITILNCHFVI